MRSKPYYLMRVVYKARRGATFMAKARALYLAHYCRPKEAAWISTLYLIRALKFTKFIGEVVILTNDPYAIQFKTKKIFKSGVKVRRIPFPMVLEEKTFGKLIRATLAYLPVFLAILKIVKSLGMDYIFVQHHNYHLASLTGALAARILKRPCIVKIQDGIPYIGRTHFESFLNHSVMAAANKLAFKLATFIFNLSKERAFLVSRTFRISKNKMLVIPNLVDLAIFSKLDRDFTREFKARYKLGGCKVLLFVGSATGRGLDRLIKALPRIIAKVGCVKLVILGDAADRSALETLASSLGVRDSLIFVKPVEHRLVPSVISLADLCVGLLVNSLVSIAGVHRKALEYMACAKPLIAAKWAVSRELLVDGETGITVENPDDAEELAKKVATALTNEELLVRMGRAARDVIETYYSCRSPVVLNRLRIALLSAIKLAKHP